jgi:hypothetical protein
MASTEIASLADILHHGASMDHPLPTEAFAPPDRALPALAEFEGELTLDLTRSEAGFIVNRDDFALSPKPEWQLSQLPLFEFSFIGRDGEILPVLREPQRTAHPYWEWVFAPGMAWRDPAKPKWSRALIPFSLKENNQNCVHNGLMTFAYKASGEVSTVAWQVGSETCLYLKVDLWGIAPAQYQPGLAAQREPIIADRIRNVTAKLTVKPIEDIHERFPAASVADFQPPELEHTSIYGFVIEGVHYRSECATRYGPHPLCDNVDLPSYSTAKSLFAGLSYLLITRLWPEFSQEVVSDWVPECRLNDARWTDVTMKDLVNMTSGNFSERDFQADETADVMSEFFLATTHAEKLRLACELWPKQERAAKMAVYHTTDHYLLGSAMSAFLRNKKGEDFDLYDKLLYPEVFSSLHLSRLTRWTQRTYDIQRQPFVGYGLMFSPDDIARLGLMLLDSSNQRDVLDSGALNSALFRTDEQRATWPGSRGDAYSHGFWGIEVTDWLNCAQETWIPFMSGYGGISIVLMPNNTVYYYFGDSDQYAFRKAVEASHRIEPICEKKQ